MRTDPRIRQTWNHISENIESANETAQANLWTFSQYYLAPCFGSIGGCVRSCTGSCFPDRDDRLRRNRSGRVRGRAENSFDFYDDWEDDGGAGGGLLRWGNDELDRLLAGSGSHGGSSRDAQPSRQRSMSYGARRGGDSRTAGARKKTAVQPHDGGPDPTIIPTTSAFGFLGRLPWKLGRKGLRYKPSAADLQEHPGAHRFPEPESEPLIEDDVESGDWVGGQKQVRPRSNTAGSGDTTDSFSSRGDLFPSEDEDDAVPLDDEFTISLERRGDETSSGKTPSSRGKRPSAGSRTASRTASSSKSSKRPRGGSTVSVTGLPHDIAQSTIMVDVPSMVDLRREEELAQREEEQEVEQKREAARALARQRGLTIVSVDNNEAHLHPSGANSKPDTPTTPGAVPVLPGDDPLTESPMATTTEIPAQIPPPPRPPIAVEEIQEQIDNEEAAFVPARLPHFSTG